MEITNLDESLEDALRLTADGEREGDILEEFWDRTKSYTVEFRKDPHYKYPHIKISKET